MASRRTSVPSSRPNNPHRTDNSMPPREFATNTTPPDLHTQPRTGLDPTAQLGLRVQDHRVNEYQTQFHPINNFSDPGPIGIPPAANNTASHTAYFHPSEKPSHVTDTCHMSQDRQGWDYDFNPKPDSKYECPICLFVLRDPIQTRCGHRFCSECIQQWLRSPPDVHCPVCNDLINESILFPDKFANREILSFTLRCPRYREGCRLTIALKDLPEHMESVCHFEQVDCPNRCGARVLRKDVTEHCENECEHRMVVCQACKQRVPHADNMEHNKKCPEMQQNCDYCNRLFLRKLILQHKTSECEEAPMDCSFLPVGCQTTLTRKSMQEHTESNMQVHLDLLMQAMKALLNSNPTRLNPADSAHRSPATAAAYSRYSSQVSKGAAKQPFGVNNKQAGPGSWEDAGQSSVAAYQRGMSQAADQSMAPSCADAFGPDGDSLKPSFFVDLDEKRRHQDGQLVKHEQQLLALSAKVDSLEKKIREQNSQLTQKEEFISALESRLCNGMYYWRIKEFGTQRQEAKAGLVTVLHSNGFYTGCHGYKLCIRANLNGVDGGNGSHISIFIHFMRGDFDDILEWPFKGRITLTILDQGDHRQHIVEVLESKPNLAAFQRPHSNRNHKGFGYIEFAPLGLIENSTYVKNDTLIIKAEVTDL